MSETITPVASQAPADPSPAAAAPAPAVSLPVAEPAPAAPVVVETPSATPETVPAAVAPEAAPAAPETAEPAKPDGFKPPTPEPSLLELAGKTDEPKTEEPPKPVTTAEDAAPVYDLKLPEGIQAAPEQMAAYTTLLGEHKMPQEAGQKLLDMHTAALKEYANHTVAEQWRVFGEMKQQWADATKSDPQLGGAGYQTSMTAVARMRDLLVPEGNREAFNKMLADTGIGNHPEFLRVLHNAARYFDEPAVQTFQPQPVSDRASGPRGRGSFRRQMYTHPSSQVQN